MTERATQLPSTKPKALILRLCLSFSRSSRVKGDKSSILTVRPNSLGTVSSLRKWTPISLGILPPFSASLRCSLYGATSFQHVLSQGRPRTPTEGVKKELLESARIAHLNPMQVAAIADIRTGLNLLVVAPTGSGKTEASLLPVIESIRHQKQPGIQVLYVTPLRALNRDMVDRLRRLVERTKLTVAVRHGDTPPSERRKQAAIPPDVLITTPETLQAILPGKLMQRHLKAVRYVIIDEVHQFAHDRRGIQLTIGLQRLRRMTERDFQRIGLSATVGHPEAIAAVFGGEKPLTVLQSNLEKKYEYRLEWPRPIDKDFEAARDLYITPEAAAGLSAIDDSLDESRSSLVFVNARPLAELLGSRLAMFRQDVAVHHGSLPREERTRVEAGFKAGEIRGLVCTSTLELGIDIGTVDHLGVLRQQGDKIRVTPKGRRYYFENLSTIRDERRYQVMDLTTQKQVGILGEEFMMIQAREGLHFIVRGRPWKIERIGKDGMVYVTPVADPNALIPGWDGEMLPVPFGLAQRVGRIRKEIDARLDRESVPKTVEHFEKAW